MTHRFWAAAALCTLAAPTLAQSSASFPSQGDDDAGLPLWELGAGVGAAVTPDYPSASGTTARVLPLPVVVYRGDFLRLGDGSAASGRLFRNERMELDLSLNGSFDAESDDVGAREGMPDLGFIFEIGPELEIILSDPAVTDRRLKLELPVRAAFSLDDRKINTRGFVFSPQLEYEREFGNGYEWSASVTTSVASRELHDYFYSVTPEFATPVRATYGARGGYLQSTLGFTLQKRTDKTFAAIGLRVSSLDGAANSASPLFRSREDVSVFALWVVQLWQSEKRVER
ncbi:MAG: MipA/OmpV family protein [Pseudomonadota bacterium]